MANGQRGAILRHVHTLFSVGTAAGLTDGQLLDRFTARGGEAAEQAFAVLVERHGPLVLRTCRSVLRDPDEAQDALQATFLVLARKAGTLRVGDSLAPWLHGVAFRTASCARSARARRLVHEQRAAEQARGRPVVEEGWDDSHSVLHDELNRLPEKFRIPLVLCYLEGLTHDQAAHQLNWPVGTVRSRLARGRDRLRGRLLRRGVAPSVAAAIASEAVSAELPVALGISTADAAMPIALVRAIAAGTVPASAIALTERMLTTMFLTKLKVAGIFLLTTGVVAAGAGVFARQVVSEPEASGPAQASQSTRADETPRPETEAQSPAKPREDDAERDAVESGDLARDQVELAKARRDARQAELRGAESRFENAKARQARLESLYKKGVVEEKLVDEANAELDDREAERDAAQAEFREAEILVKQAERLLSRPDRPTTRSGPPRSDEAKLAEIRRDARAAALRAATARVEQAKAELARLTMLNRRGAGFVSPPELSKAEAEVEDRAAQRDIVRAELQEAELLAEQAGRLPAQPDRQTARPVAFGATDPVALDRQLREMDRKLDRILQILENRSGER